MLPDYHKSRKPTKTILSLFTFKNCLDFDWFVIHLHTNERPFNLVLGMIFILFQVVFCETSLHQLYFNLIVLHLIFLYAFLKMNSIVNMKYLIMTEYLRIELILCNILHNKWQLKGVYMYYFM